MRSWCCQEARLDGGRGAIQGNSDILIIHVDTDVAAEAEIDRARECPPPGDSANEVRTLILEWLGVNGLSEDILLCVPSMSSETWALVALYPDDPLVVPCDTTTADSTCVECRRDIKARLRRLGSALRPKLIVPGSGRGALKSNARAFRAHQDRLTNGWNNVTSVCSEARRFDADLCAALP
ncbi:MAG: hypothetical protein CL908_15985 [Deltaproteobacteria bacterium]|nr:hypothetical protein [Deltaproteobacteria bacterium]